MVGLMSQALSVAAQQLRLWRDAEGFSQMKAASALGLEQSQFSKFERGVRKPGRSLAVRIERATDGRVRVADWDEDDLRAAAGA